MIVSIKILHELRNNKQYGKELMRHTVKSGDDEAKHWANSHTINSTWKMNKF